MIAEDEELLQRAYLISRALGDEVRALLHRQNETTITFSTNTIRAENASANFGLTVSPVLTHIEPLPAPGTRRDWTAHRKARKAKRREKRRSQKSW